MNETFLYIANINNFNDMDKVILQKVIYVSPSVDCYKVDMSDVFCVSRANPNPTGFGEDFNDPEYE